MTHRYVGSSSRLRNTVLALLLACLTPLLLFTALEGLLALLGVTPLADEARYVEAAQQRQCRFGYRAARIWCSASADLDEGRRVILTLGGSSVFGYRAEGFEFPHVLQQLLDQSHPGEYRVVNLGRPCKDSIYVRRCFELALAARPELVVVYAGHNDYANWGLNDPERKILLEEHAWIYDLERRASAGRTYSLLARLWGSRQRGLEEEAPEPPDLEHVERASALILDEFTRNITRVIDLAGSRGAQVVLVTVVSNLYEFPFRKRRWDLLALTPEPRSPRKARWRAHYLDAIEQFRSGRFEAALEEFKQARDWRPEGRAPRALNQRLRELSAAHPHVQLVDFERRLDRLGVREGIGCNYFGDTNYCDQFHPNANTHDLIARSIFESVEQMRGDRPPGIE